MLSDDLNNTKRQSNISVDSQLPIIESWMTSLKKHTIDYNENTFLNVKRIPSRYTSWLGSELIDEMGILNKNNNNSNDNNNNLSVVNYRKNDQLVKDNVTTKRLCQFFNIFVNDDSCTSRDKNSCHLNNNDLVNSNNNFLILFNQNNNKKFDLKNCLHHLSLSFGLNQIVISYDDKLKFLVNNRAQYNIKGPKTLINKYFQLLKFIDSKNNSNNNRNDDNYNKINYFIKNTIENYSLNYKKNILDYEIKCVNINNVTDARTIDDFVFKTNCLKMKKNFNDFCLNSDESVNNNKIEMIEENKSDLSNSVKEAAGDDRILRRDTITKNRIKNLNVYRNAMGRQNREDDYIYQPIWKFQTIGNSPDDEYHDTSSIQANLAIPDDISDSDNWSNAEHDFAFQNFTFIDDNSLEYIDASSNNDNTLDHINNDSNNNNNNNCDDKIKSSPYSKVIIEYNLNNPLLNKIDYCQSNDNCIKTNQQINSIKNNNLYNKYHNCNTNSYNKTIKNILNANLPKNIENWQLNLLNYNLIEDEEDVIMTDRSVNENRLQDQTSIKTISNEVIGKTSFTETTRFGFAKMVKNALRKINTENRKHNQFLSDKMESTSENPKSSLNTEKIAGHDSLFGTYSLKKFADESEYNNGSLKNDAESETTSVKSSASLKESPKSSPTNSEKKIIKPKPTDKDKRKEKDKVFGVDLDKVELDTEFGVPKFIVECIKIVEEDENLKTNGIYRASGNKNNIENIKKKMNEKRYIISKESKYTFLQNQDLHTITGALKLFFRETSDLIPEAVFANLPKNLSCKENLETVKTQIKSLDEVQFETLKYLMKHLRKVHDNNSENLMTSSNLSIIWGASLFTKSVNSIMSLIENDIMNRNVLIRVLIDNYDYVFNEDSFSNDSIIPNIDNNDNSNVVNQR